MLAAFAGDLSSVPSTNMEADNSLQLSPRMVDRNFQKTACVSWFSMCESGDQAQTTGLAYTLSHFADLFY